ncbi:hypothetical protein [Clostridium puniceum]|uniref:hypothetical protein n=1 Tax=Clostridium puniceum TaxID=29367 RepID=UPI001A9A3A05|nr:hypothetical protein [Clostridium puniceum]
MIAFYLVRGFKLEYLLNKTHLEKAFFHCARKEYYEEEKLKWRSILSEAFGGGE